MPLQDEKGKPTGKRANGAIIAFGVTAESEPQAREAIQSWFSRDRRFADLSYRLDYYDVTEIEDFQSEIHEDENFASALVQDPKKTGLWYRSGVGSIVQMKALYATNRELTSCLLCAIVGVGAGRQPSSRLYSPARGRLGDPSLT